MPLFRNEVSERRAAADAAPGAPDSGSSEHGDGPLVLSDPRFVYAPLWDAAQDNIFAYRCAPLWQQPDGRFVAIEAFGEAFADPADRLSVDIDVFDKAIGHINRIAQYGILKIVIPVHLTTLLDDGLQASYLACCAESVWSVFDSVAFEIVGIGSEVSVEQAAVALDVIHAYGSQVYLCIDGNDTRCVPRQAEASSVFIGRNARRMGLEGDALAEALAEFARHAAELPYRTFVHGLRSLKDTASAIAAGYAIVGSEAIAPAVEEPGAASADDDATRTLRRMMLDKRRG